MFWWAILNRSVENNNHITFAAICIQKNSQNICIQKEKKNNRHKIFIT